MRGLSFRVSPDHRGDGQRAAAHAKRLMLRDPVNGHRLSFRACRCDSQPYRGTLLPTAAARSG